MEKILHPVSGETVYVVTEREKEIIDSALENTFSSKSGVENG